MMKKSLQKDKKKTDTKAEEREIDTVKYGGLAMPTHFCHSAPGESSPESKGTRNRERPLGVHKRHKKDGV